MYQGQLYWDVFVKGIPDLLVRSQFAHDWRYKSKLTHWIHVLEQRLPHQTEMTRLTLAQGITTMQLADEQMVDVMDSTWLNRPLTSMREEVNWRSYWGGPLQRKKRRIATITALKLNSRWGGYHSFNSRWQEPHGKPADSKYYRENLPLPLPITKLP
jgi:hypothetical protein